MVKRLASGLNKSSGAVAKPQFDRSPARRGRKGRSLIDRVQGGDIKLTRSAFANDAPLRELALSIDVEDERSFDLSKSHGEGPRAYACGA